MALPDRSSALGVVTPPRAPSSRRAQVVEILRSAIVSGELAPGAHLKQDELCARFALSPTPVREALRELQAEGLVHHTPGRGVIVLDMSRTELLELLVPVRMAIEAYALPLAASNMSEQDWSELESIVEDMGRQAKDGRLEALNDSDVRFHEVAIAASGSPHALQLWHSVLPRIRLQFGRLAPLHGDLSEIQAEHRDLLSVLRSQDPNRIVPALHAHIVASAAQLLVKPATRAREVRS